MTARRAFAAGVLATALMSSALLSPASAEQVEFNLDASLKARDAELPYKLDLTLSAQGPTRVEVDALLDLREFQKSLPELAVGEVVLDVCGNETSIRQLQVTAEDEDLRLVGQVQSKFFVCDNIGGGSFQRGASRFDLDLDFSATASVNLVTNCIVFKLADLDVRPREQVFEEGNENLETARALLVSAADLILAESPVCPELPPELVSLDPIYNEGGPRELGEGGVGIYLRGSVDVAPQTIIDILTVLQTNGVIPGRP